MVKLDHYKNKYIKRYFNLKINVNFKLGSDTCHFMIGAPYLNIWLGVRLGVS